MLARLEIIQFQTYQYIPTVPASLEKLQIRVLDHLKYYDFPLDYFTRISQDESNTKWIVYGRAKHRQGLTEKTKQQLDGFFEMHWTIPFAARIPNG